MASCLIYLVFFVKMYILYYAEMCLLKDNIKERQLVHMENTPKFQVIKGGLAETPFSGGRQFVSSYVTDTRLMGVIGVYIHWYLPENKYLKHFHQFFYLDAEEFGFDSYEGILESDDGAKYYDIKAVENKMIGGLGGQKMRISEREARSIIQSYAEMNRKMGIPLPDKTEEYEFLLSPAEELSPEEEYALLCKECPSLSSPCQVINYFLMRCFGRDFKAAKYLTRGYVRTDIFPEHKAATLLSNSIDDANDADSGSNTDYHIIDDDRDFGTFSTRKAYLCQSLIEYDSKYYIIVTQLTLDKLKVVKYEKVSSFRVSAIEANMMTSRPEFITIFDPVDENIYESDQITIENNPGLVFTLDSTDLVNTAMETEHEAGRVFMIFYPHNDHVNSKEYRLSNDVLGVYYILYSGQFVLCAYDKHSIDLLEKDLTSSSLGPQLVLTAKYQFKEPILYDFINSQSDDFCEFADLISSDGNDDGGD